ncbi:efflux RND transporter periplasmic adaptor subunit [Phocaeicola coprocola]|uniref:efflux RND transporter periplasmic adaptor subunit n=1 Tax=Phocaeicola coprocola TaxID=310298 RepID=UPI00266D748C|nr:efflux RND transporter periplasmic adaptor subunit [Phocaeicola coprocola]
MKHYIFMGALAACMLGSCGGHEGHGHEAEGEAKEAHAAHADEIVLTPEKAQAAGVQVEEVQPAAFRSVIPTSGQVLAAQGDEATVVAAVSGVVNFTRSLIEGTQVSAGMALLTVSSQHIQEGDPVKRARIAYETAKSEYERAAKLVDKQIVSQKDFNQLKENYENARIAYEALSPSKDGKGVAVKSPIGGYVKSCLVKEGDYVTVGQPLLTVTQTRRLQLKAEVSERYYAGLKSIVSANFTTTYDDKVYRLDDLKGRLLSYGKSSGDASYYIPVTFEFDNRGDVIPGSFVEVYLLSEERQGVISLPVSAITEEQGLNFVYLQVDAECYKKQEVKLGMNDGCRVEVLSGLKGGEKVVTVGAMHVKLAAAGNTIPGHTHNH